MVFESLLEGLLIVLIWVGAWGIVEMAIDRLSNDNQCNRLTLYLFIFVVGVAALGFIYYQRDREREQERPQFARLNPI